MRIDISILLLIAVVILITIAFLIYISYLLYKKLPKVFCVVITAFIITLTSLYAIIPLDKILRDFPEPRFTIKDAIEEISHEAKLTWIVNSLIFIAPILIIGMCWFVINKVYRQETTYRTTYAIIYILLIGYLSLPIGMLAIIICFPHYIKKLIDKLYSRIT